MRRLSSVTILAAYSLMTTVGIIFLMLGDIESDVTTKQLSASSVASTSDVLHSKQSSANVTRAIGIRQGIHPKPQKLEAGEET